MVPLEVQGDNYETNYTRTIARDIREAQKMASQ